MVDLLEDRFDILELGVSCLFINYFDRHDRIEDKIRLLLDRRRFGGKASVCGIPLGAPAKRKDEDRDQKEAASDG
ncbi:transcriptional regulator [Paenibacillus popilliae ATCC 14706]|uniref:Transcriptional regulator n=1 Tax=Paenibacillus popilliae ATCC 14706 TaxID=1212764 RepID=M9LM38_PAEPP|nr:transcriptional regulator [Paenibacillus popilliae ATCC 14706]